MIYAGLDLHQKFWVVTVMDAQGKEIIKQQKLPNNGKLSDFFQTFEGPVTVAMEATAAGTGFTIFSKTKE